VANEEVAKSTKSKPQSAVLKLGWNADKQMWVFGLDLSVGIHLMEQLVRALVDIEGHALS
jgi:hypothetical protein